MFFLQFLAVGSGATLESVRVIILSKVVGRTLLVTTKIPHKDKLLVHTLGSYMITVLRLSVVSIGDILDCVGMTVCVNTLLTDSNSSD